MAVRRDPEVNIFQSWASSFRRSPKAQYLAFFAGAALLVLLFVLLAKGCTNSGNQTTQATQPTYDRLEQYSSYARSRVSQEMEIHPNTLNGIADIDCVFVNSSIREVKGYDLNENMVTVTARFQIRFKKSETHRTPILYTVSETLFKDEFGGLDDLATIDLISGDLWNQISYKLTSSK